MVNCQLFFVWCRIGDIMEKLKIMVFNVGYFTGINGSLAEYLNYSYRYLYRGHKEKPDLMLALSKLIDREKPDIAFLMETHNEDDLLRLLNRFPLSQTENKYQKGGMLEITPFFRRNCNSIIARRDFKVKKSYLKSGSKRLIYEVKLNPQTTLIFGHFALAKDIRLKQLKELEDIIKKTPRVIIGGDFNTAHDVKSMIAFAKRNNLKIVDIKRSKTYPAHNPKKPLDFFVCSKDIKVNNFKVLSGVKISDHLPVVIEVEI